jgi:hypothetical protein
MTKKLLAFLNGRSGPGGVVWDTELTADDFEYPRHIRERARTTTWDAIKDVYRERGEPFDAAAEKHWAKELQRMHAEEQRTRFDDLQKRVIALLYATCPDGVRYTLAQEQRPRARYGWREFRVTFEADWNEGIVRVHAYVGRGPRAVINRLLYLAYALVQDVGPERIRICQRQKCGRLFVKTTRKAFCSTNCQSRDYMRAYRANDYHPVGRNRKGRRDGKKTRAR